MPATFSSTTDRSKTTRFASRTWSGSSPIPFLNSFSNVSTAS
jgi:hypothetical protein